MNKKLMTLGLAVAALALTACGNKTQDKKGNADNSPKESTTATAPANGARIAFVEIDTLLNQYQLCIDQKEVLEAEAKNADNTMTQKQKSLQQRLAAFQQRAANFQQKMQSNGFTSQEEYTKAQSALENEQATLQREDAQMQDLGARLQNGIMEQEMKYTEERTDSVQAFLADYNKAKKFDLILPKSGTSILLANPALDITNDVVQGLNKRYKRSEEMAKKLKK